MLKCLLILISIIILFLNNLKILSILIAIIFLIALFFIEEFKLKDFLEKLDKLSIFCITIFISYATIAFFKESENIFFIYAKNAILIILKIIDIILVSFFISNSKLLFLSKNNTIKNIFKYFPIIENILFEVLSQYPGKISKLKNIDKIIVDFIYKSMLCIQNYNIKVKK